MGMVFLNLTNGLLYDGPFDGFIRIQSCHCEQKLWDRLIREIDSNFLMWLALGKDIIVVDYSPKKDVPRALFQGIEWLWFCCCKVWKLPINVSVRGNDCIKYFEHEFHQLDKATVKKLKYYIKFLNNPKKPNIVSGRTNRDGDYEYFSQVAKNLVIKTEIQ